MDSLNKKIGHILFVLINNTMFHYVNLFTGLFISHAGFSHSGTLEPKGSPLSRLGNKFNFGFKITVLLQKKTLCSYHSGIMLVRSVTFLRTVNRYLQIAVL